MKKTSLIIIFLLVLLAACTNNENSSEVEMRIIFDSNGGSIVDSIILDGISPVIMPNDPVKEGYTFIGWYLDNGTFNVMFDINAQTGLDLKEDLTLYANWIMDEMPSYFALGGFHSALLTSYGNLFIWGSNRNGQIGNSTTTDKINPFNVTSFFNLKSDEKIIKIELAISQSAALTSSGNVFVWGWNGLGQLGDGTNIDRNKPVNITSRFNLSTGETITSISLGALRSGALSSKGRLFIWGSGPIGDGTTIQKNTPTDITSRFNLSTGETLTALSLGNTHSAALTSKGRLFTWGSNNAGQLGDGTTIQKNIPTDITSRFNLSTGETLTALSLGGFHSATLTSTGRLFTWGNNSNGRLGDGTVTNRLRPLDVTLNVNLASEEKLIHINLGLYHSMVISSDGTIFTWGQNDAGQLGDGTVINRNRPTNITSKFSFN